MGVQVTNPRAWWYSEIAKKESKVLIESKSSSKFVDELVRNVRFCNRDECVKVTDLR